MGEKFITACRLCKHKQLGYAFRVEHREFVFCKQCTLLQRKDDIPFEIQFNFEGRFFDLWYYPSFLARGDVTPLLGDECLFFSFAAIERLLNDQRYSVLHVKRKDDRLFVAFEKMTPLESLRMTEKKMRLDNQYTYFLWALKVKK